MSKPALEVRSLRFPFGRVPRAWHGRGRSITTFFDNLSIFFPVGERFFVASVRAHDRFIPDHDDALRADVRAFCGQEGIHGREHARYNAWLRDHGYDVDAMERRILGILRLAKKVLPARSQLAATCALEHFTALLAQSLLSDPRMLEGADPIMAALWRWHAAEENEHRAVAYDVFLAAGGGHRERVALMIVASVVFWAKIAEQQTRMMKHDGTLLSGREWAALGRFLFVTPGGLRRLVRPYFAYYRRGFHPNDIDCEGLLDAVRQELDSSLYAAPAERPEPRREARVA